MCVCVQVLLSGGVDSTVCTALLNKALNQEQVIAVHIDNGFMRKRESQSVEEALTKLGIKLKGNIQKVPFGKFSINELINVLHFYSCVIKMYLLHFFSLFVNLMNTIFTRNARYQLFRTISVNNLSRYI